MRVLSTTFKDGQSIPQPCAEPGCGGANIRPALAWTGAPFQTKSYAITIFDPDAPRPEGWWHYLVIDIPEFTTSIRENAVIPFSAREWVNDYGYLGYGGPNPPEGPAHRYIHTVYALPRPRLDVPDDATATEVEQIIKETAIASASITGYYQNEASRQDS